MNLTLDIGPLRSLVAVADCGGFHRAAAALHLTQSAVSQHVRRLEKTVGRPLVEKDGRGSRFTVAGEVLVAESRRVLAAHDAALRSLGVRVPVAELVFGSTEHGADDLLPAVSSALGNLHGGTLRFRLDRTTALTQAVDGGSIDAALVLGSTTPTGHSAGSIPLLWVSAPGWQAGPITSFVAFDEPCAIRRRAVQVLSTAGLRPHVAAESPHLAGVHAAVRAGLGITLLPLIGEAPPGLVVRHDLPVVEPLDLEVRVRRGADPEIGRVAAAAVRRLVDDRALVAA